MTGRSVAYAVVRDDPPVVYVADDIDVLQRLLALCPVAEASSTDLLEEQRHELQQALLGEKWGDALLRWIGHTGMAVDVYTDLVFSSEDLPEEMVGVHRQFSPLFRKAS